MSDLSAHAPAGSDPPQNTDQESQTPVVLARAFERLLIVGFALAPLPAITYLHQYGTATRLFRNHGVHEVAIATAIGVSAAVTWIASRCYLARGEPMLRWLTLSLLAMTAIYAPHGILTRLASENPPMFLLYGPASRCTMAALLLVSLLSADRAPDPPERRRKGITLWLPWLGLFMLINVAVAVVAADRGAPHALVRIVLESGAIALNLGCLVALLRRRRLSPLLIFFGLGIAFFVQSSASFFLARPWNHQWWLAHAIFASGFLLMSYGVLRAFLTTRSLTAVFSAEELMQQTLAANARAHRAIRALHESNRKLEQLATTDSLTGLANRRHFLDQFNTELKRARRDGRPVSVLALDLDHFKRINDRHGHAAGDRVLQHVSELIRDQLRPADHAGRLGGEEFAVLLPETAADGALAYAERIRAALADSTIEIPDGPRLQISASIGVATAPDDGHDAHDLLIAADERLYTAKHAGRNRVCAA